MIILPAIDLKQGQCVRLYQGEMAQATVYSDDPAAMARQWQSLGAGRLHLVDLDGAFAGRPVNGEAIRAILGAVTLPVQLGGGIRDLATIEGYLSLGVATAILGTIACRDPELVRQACRLFPGRVSVGIDARAGMAAVSGWAEETAIPALDLARRFEDAGVAAVIYTDISRDGALSGPNVEATRRLAEEVTIPVIASGGVSSVEDIRRLRDNAGPFANGGHIMGAIVGKALYDGRLTLPEAVRAAT